MVSSRPRTWKSHTRFAVLLAVFTTIQAMEGGHNAVPRKEPVKSIHLQHIDAAVCISGQPRSYNIPVPQNQSEWPENTQWRFQELSQVERRSFMRWQLRKNPKLTPVATIHKFLYPALGKFHVFMYVPSKSESDIDRAEAAAACAAYAPRNKDSIQCQIGIDFEIGNEYLGITWWEMKMLARWSYWPWQNLLQQLNGHYACNRMIRDAEVSHDIEYSWIVRLRADSLFLAPVPSLKNIHRDENVVYIPGCGETNTHTDGRDLFNIGAAEIMHEFLDRMMDFAREVSPFPGQRMPLWVSLHMGFTPESFATLWMSLTINPSTGLGRKMQSLCLKIGVFRKDCQLHACH